MLQGDFKRVIPQLAENHLDHIMKHQQLMQSPHFQQLAATAPNLIQEIIQFDMQHIQQHMQMMQMVQAMMAAAQKQQKGMGGESGAFAGNAGGNQEAGSQQGMAGMQGPMGEALNTQKQGKVQQT
jgi:hypothetical protein